MRKFILSLALVMGAVFSASAQIAFEEPILVDNMYVGASVGATTPLQFTEVFPLNAFGSVRIGKEFNPIVAMELEGTLGFGSHTAHNGRYSWHQAVRETNVGLNGTINLTNAFLGVGTTRRNFELLTVTGFGWGHGFVNKAYGKDVNSLTARTGLEGRFNVSNSLAFTVQPTVLWGLTHTGRSGVKFNSNHAQLSLAVGVVYHFKNSNGTHYWVSYDIDELNKEINRLRAENNDLRHQPKEVVKETVEVEVPKEVAVLFQREFTVFFEKAKADLSDEAKAILSAIPTDVTVDVVGTASPEGTKKFNQKISEKRAEVVKAFLEARGVNVNSAVGKGVVGNTSNRVAVVTLAD